MNMNNKPRRGRLILEGKGGVRLMVHVTQEMLDSMDEKTRVEKLEDTRIKREDQIWQPSSRTTLLKGVFGAFPSSRRCPRFPSAGFPGSPWTENIFPS